MSANDTGTSEQKVPQQGLDLTITDAMPIGISVLAPDGTTLYMNQLAFDRIGVTLDEVKGKGHLEHSYDGSQREAALDEYFLKYLPSS